MELQTLQQAGHTITRSLLKPRILCLPGE